MQPRTSHVTTGSVKPRSSDGAFNQTKAWKGFEICTESDTSPYLALAIKASLSQQKILQRTSSSPWTFTPLFDWKPKEKEGFFCSCKLHRADASKTLLVRGFASNFLCSGNQESLGNAETNQRLGMSLTPSMRIQCSLASPSEDSSEKGNQSLDFPHFATFVHTL